MMARQPRKQHLIDTAYRLFNEHGYHATGIDRILEESGVSKATLYKHFRSKEALILAVLQQRHEQLLQRTEEHIGKAETAGHTPVLALFDALHEWFQSPDFFGCNFINASAEYAGQGDVIHLYAAKHKAEMRQVIWRQLGEFGTNARKMLTEQLALLIEGAIVTAHVNGDKGAAITAKRIAEILLQR